MSNQLMRQIIADYFKMQPVLKITTLLVIATFVGCKTNNITETQRFERSIVKELPFVVDSIHWLTGVDVPTFKEDRYILPSQLSTIAALR